MRPETQTKGACPPAERNGSEREEKSGRKLGTREHLAIAAALPPLVVRGRQREKEAGEEDDIAGATKETNEMEVGEGVIPESVTEAVTRTSNNFQEFRTNFLDFLALCDPDTLSELDPLQRAQSLLLFAKATTTLFT